MKRLLGTCMLLGVSALIFGQGNTNQNKFRQLKQELPTPNMYRTASGAPGHGYYQQQADYNIKVDLDEKKQTISGSETITYHNNSPDELTYLWLQLDQNRRAINSNSHKIQTGKLSEQRASRYEQGRNGGISFGALKQMYWDFDGGFKIGKVTDAKGKALPYTINQTMMRVDLPEPLKPGDEYVFKIDWWYNVNDRGKVGGRSGYEFFQEEDNSIYTIAQFYPRMAVYNEIEGWQHKQFLGRGEFALCFGDYHVEITVPEDHIVGATGSLSNAKEVLSSAQQKRLEDAKNSLDKPVFVVNQKEAEKNEENHAPGKKTWIFEAENVRDFGWASSRKFIWDAMGVKFGDRTVLAMSYYPKEGNPLWEKYSTRVVAHTISTYSKYTIDYPYPVAISVNAANIGMEYPMICFNYGRPEKDGTYTARLKYGVISVIIHEVGHNFFPMIVNSDERQWTWMDEGLNTFVQYLAEQEWERDYPSRRGPAYKIADYMKGDKSQISPIMTNSESIWQFGNNAYGKPATALNILRETVMGRELFDYAFKEYCRRWAFKHPTPADLFRTMEDASAVDLDWFWRGWFYTNDHVDISIDDVKWFQVNTRDPKVEKGLQRTEKDALDRHIGVGRNKDAFKTVTEKDSSMVDFYTTYDPYEATYLDGTEYQEFKRKLTEEEIKLLQKGDHFYEVTFRNIGGLVMPLILEFEYVDGSKEEVRIPAEIWKMSTETISKVFVCEKEVKSISLDPFLETADTDLGNNYWPRRPQPTRFQVFKDKQRKQENPMQRDKRNKELMMKDK